MQCVTLNTTQEECLYTVRSLSLYKVIVFLEITVSAVGFSSFWILVNAFYLTLHGVKILNLIKCQNGDEDSAWSWGGSLDIFFCV